MRREAIGSLKRLQTDRIDLYQFHHIDRHISWPELWQAMEVLVARGEVVYTGSSNFAAWNIAQANEIAQQRHFLGLVSEQSLYNLAQRSIELEVIPAAQNYGLGILPWSPLGGGLLSGGSTDPKARSAGLTSARAKRQDQLDVLSSGSRRSAGGRRRRSDSRGCCTSRGSPDRLWGPGRSRSWNRPSRRSTSVSATKTSRPSTSSSPVLAGRRRRPTPGKAVARGQAAICTLLYRRNIVYVCKEGFLDESHT